ncbi:hypothetical protein [Xanthomarina spongicola]|uniref:Uncharacterized protein n=1 Tax=Xanthomarina spongicola TaxID=570520 RepID=A0A316DK19_9FLAO|nr:hypothetical protein [Xanthomarina spongicola]PWK18577.1 hypothetical protein LX78_01884 [Xanthomarina spongicola]
MNRYRELVVLVFKKSANDIDSDIVTQQAKYIVDKVEELHNFQINERTLRNYYNNLIKKNKVQINISPAIADHLSKFLEYEDFNDYVNKNPIPESKLVKPKKTKERIIVGSLIVIASYFGFDSLSNKCMTWTDNVKYEKVSCEEVNAIPIQENLLNNFKRIDPECNYMFFKEDGSANLWYGKSINGEYEFFNHFGVHPITGRTLKEVTIYIKEKYICKENN